MPRLALLFSYNGTFFHGWQKQERLNTVQGELEQALTWVLRTPVVTQAAGRTDRGVHATGQVAHVDIEGALPALSEIKRRVNAICFPRIAIRDVVLVEEDFHARFSAIWRKYCYQISTEPDPLHHETVAVMYGKPDVSLLHVMAEKLVGLHDLLGFSKENEQHTSSTCEVMEAYWLELSPVRFQFHIKANRFLHHTVRGMVGTMWDVATGKKTMVDFDEVLYKANRAKCGTTALAKGLILEAVGYKTPLFKDLEAP
jgi:tRNA pseudouridine38-40 synthase